ncbi:MAG: hypothetical protein H6978_13720 [Gammaproteobacteria bacterium]|nr:hypothetical protein [Gammaproteobacteria bacterium]
MIALFKPERFKLLLEIIPVLVLVLGARVASAQNGEFMDCAQYTDRAERLACLEQALDEATTTEAGAPPAQTVTPQESRTNQPVRGEATSDLPRIATFGLPPAKTRLSVDAQGQESLHDTVVKLEKYGSFVQIELAGGQIWEQSYPRAYNLEVGDKVRIYRAGFGDGYRLKTDRLSGFIRVRRLE